MRFSPTRQQHSRFSLQSIVALMVLSLALFFAEQRLDLGSPVRRLLMDVVYPLQWTVAQPFAWWQEGRQWWQDRATLLAEKERLSRLQRETASRLQKLAGLEEEIGRLQRLLGASARVDGRVTWARLMQVHTDPVRHQLMIDKGLRDGLYVGQPVLDAGGIMGQLVQLGDFSATVLLISDPAHALPVQVLRTGLRGILQGTGKQDELEMLYISPSADIRVGDRLITSGLGGRFPAHYPVAVVAGRRHLSGQHFVRVWARPSAALDQGSEVLLLETR